MPQSDECEFYLSRVDAEREMAANANDGREREAHQRLAMHYAALASSAPSNGWQVDLTHVLQSSRRTLDAAADVLRQTAPLVKPRW